MEDVQVKAVFAPVYAIAAAGTSVNDRNRRRNRIITNTQKLNLKIWQCVSAISEKEYMNSQKWVKKHTLLLFQQAQELVQKLHHLQLSLMTKLVLNIHLLTTNFFQTWQLLKLT